MNIGENILKMRKEKGITQEQLADVLCISAGAVSKWETESSIPDIGMLPKIANFFGVSIDRLFDFELTESDAPENIIKRVKAFTVGFNYDESVVRHDNIKVVFECGEAISVLTDACIKFPNNYKLKTELCWYKHLGASKYKDRDNYKKAEQEILDELYSITRLTADREITDRCQNIICQIYIALEEYDKAVETVQKYQTKFHSSALGNNHTILTALLKQGKNEEAEKQIHDITYISLMQIYVSVMSSMSIVKDEEKLKKINFALIDLLKIFSDGSPGPFDYYLSENYKVLGVLHLSCGKYDESMMCFEESYNYAERFKIFAETREITSDFLKYADKTKFLYNMPYDYKQFFLSVFEAFESEASKEYSGLKDRDDFKKFIEKLKG